MSGQPRRRRTPVNAVVALVLTAAAALAGPVPASGAGPGTGGAAAGHGVFLPGTGPTGLPDTEVTLITGDRVLISTAPDGRTAVTVEPAAGAEPQSYRTVRAPDGDVYVYPSAADAGLDSGLLDPDLFNVTELVRQGYDDRGTGEIPLVVHYGARAVAEATGTMPAARTVVTVPRLNFASVRVDKSRAVDFWRSLAPSPVGARSAAGS